MKATSKHDVIKFSSESLTYKDLALSHPAIDNAIAQISSSTIRGNKLFLKLFFHLIPLIYRSTIHSSSYLSQVVQ